MIQVQARLTRGSVYLAGEVIECLVTFRNPTPDPNAHSNNDVEENLAWASVQILCYCCVDQDKVRFPINASCSLEELATASKDTSFIPSKGESGHVVLATKPKILFCDLRLLPGECKTFVYRETLPNDNAPPTYKGQVLKYTYKVTIGTQRVNAPIKLMRMPIRVLTLSTGNVGNDLAHIPTEESEAHFSPTNPFLQSGPKGSPLDVSLQLLEAITARRNPSYYNITNQNGKVVRFCLLKSSYRLGEDILGLFDFSQATVPCVQYSVTLQSEESVKEEFRVNPKASSKSFSTTVSCTKHHEVCLHLSHTQMVLPIPLSVTPSFTSNIVSLQWKLHFEFVTTTTPIPGVPPLEDAAEGVIWQGPPSLDVQTMVWDLPITIHPTHPLHVAQGLPCKSEATLTIW